MHVGIIGNITPPVGGAEVFLREFFSHYLKPPRQRATLVRWRKQVFMYLPERLVRVYAPRGQVDRMRGMGIHYVFEALERPRYQRRHVFEQELINQYTRHGETAASIFGKQNTQLVHAHMLFPNLFFAETAARILSVPLMVTIHGMLEFRILDTFGKKYPTFSRLVEKSIRRAQLVVVASREIGQEACRRGARRVVTLPGGIDTAWYRPAQPAPKRKGLLFVGTVRQDKGASLLIQAFERLSNRIPDHLTFIGTPLLAGPIMQRAKRNRHIHFVGLKQPAQIRKALQEAQLLVLPSRSEGLSLSVLEAMACETPVLAPAAGELPTVIQHGHNGFLVQKRTPRAVADQILGILLRNDLAQIGKRARAATVPFDIRSVVRQYLSLYRSLIR